jgi:anti-anti-sigma regulatory factor
MVETVPGWKLDIRQIGEWLCVRITGPRQDDTELDACMSRLWTIVQKRQAYRLVLELDELKRLTSPVIGHLIRLEQQLTLQGGLLRLSGLSPQLQDVLNTFVSRLERRFRCYPNREVALRSEDAPAPGAA